MHRAPWRSALVTGASSGIGLAMATQLAEAGVPTVAVARRGDRLGELATAHAGIEPLAADLHQADGRAAVVARLLDDDRPIDLLVNNAGFGLSGAFHERTVDEHLAQIDLNIDALVALTSASLGPMRARRRGWVLQVSSLASFQAGPNAAVYAATKAFVTSLTESLSEELRGSGVKVCALCPGFTRTEFQDRSGMANVDRVPDMAWMSAADVARAGLRAMAAGRVIEIPGAGYKGLAALSSALPRSLVRRLTGLGSPPAR